MLKEQKMTQEQINKNMANLAQITHANSIPDFLKVSNKNEHHEANAQEIINTNSNIQTPLDVTSSMSSNNIFHRESSIIASEDDSDNDNQNSRSSKKRNLEYTDDYAADEENKLPMTSSSSSNNKVTDLKKAAFKTLRADQEESLVYMYKITNKMLLLMTDLLIRLPVNKSTRNYLKKIQTEALEKLTQDALRITLLFEIKYSDNNYLKLVEEFNNNAKILTGRVIFQIESYLIRKNLITSDITANEIQSSRNHINIKYYRDIIDIYKQLAKNELQWSFEEGFAPIDIIIEEINDIPETTQTDSSKTSNSYIYGYINEYNAKILYHKKVSFIELLKTLKVNPEIMENMLVEYNNLIEPFRKSASKAVKQLDDNFLEANFILMKQKFYSNYDIILKEVVNKIRPLLSESQLNYLKNNKLIIRAMNNNEEISWSFDNNETDDSLVSTEDNGDNNSESNIPFTSPSKKSKSNPTSSSQTPMVDYSDSSQDQLNNNITIYHDLLSEKGIKTAVSSKKASSVKVSSKNKKVIQNDKGKNPSSSSSTTKINHIESDNSKKRNLDTISDQNNVVKERDILTPNQPHTNEKPSETPQKDSWCTVMSVRTAIHDNPGLNGRDVEVIAFIKSSMMKASTESSGHITDELPISSPAANVTITEFFDAIDYNNLTYISSHSSLANATNYRGDSALFMASIYGHQNISQYLIKQGAQAPEYNQKKETLNGYINLDQEKQYTQSHWNITHPNDMFNMDWSFEKNNLSYNKIPETGVDKLSYNIIPETGVDLTSSYSMTSFVTLIVISQDIGSVASVEIE